MKNEKIDSMRKRDSSKLFSLANQAKSILTGFAIATIGFGTMIYGYEKEKDLSHTHNFQQCVSLEHELKRTVYGNDNYSLGKSINRELAGADLYHGACSPYVEDRVLNQHIIHFRDYTLLDERESLETKGKVNELTQKLFELKRNPEYRKEKEFMENNSFFGLMLGGCLLGFLGGIPLILTGVSRISMGE